MKIPAGNNIPEEINVFVEIPAGGEVKYEYDKKMQALFVDRYAFTSMHYPFNYGFIPNTKAEDGDALDVIIISSKKVYPGAVVPCRPVGMLEMEDEKGIDAKIIAAPLLKIDPFYTYIKDIDDINQAVKNKIKHFFEYYKELEPGKWVKIKEWRNKKTAEEAIKKALT